MSVLDVITWVLIAASYVLNGLTIRLIRKTARLRREREKA